MELSIMPECYADTLLIEILVPPKNKYNHKSSCTQVELSVRNSSGFAVGIIDNDKIGVKYLETFEILDKVENSLMLWKHRVKHHYFIQICPALERWILNICKKGGKGAEEFGLPSELKDLMRITKSMSSKKDDRLRRLFMWMKSRDEIEEIRKLKGWLKLLVTKNFNVEKTELKNV